MLLAIANVLSGSTLITTAAGNMESFDEEDLELMKELCELLDISEIQNPSQQPVEEVHPQAGAISKSFNPFSGCTNVEERVDIELLNAHGITDELLPLLNIEVYPGAEKASALPNHKNTTLHRANILTVLDLLALKSKDRSNESGLGLFTGVVDGLVAMAQELAKSCFERAVSDTPPPLKPFKAIGLVALDEVETPQAREVSAISQQTSDADEDKANVMKALDLEIQQMQQRVRFLRSQNANTLGALNEIYA